MPSDNLYNIHFNIRTVVLAVACLSIIGCGDRGQPAAMPSFNMILVDGTSLNTKDIPAGKPIVMVYYDGECGNCHDEAREIMARMEDLKDVRFYFITVEPVEEVKRFVSHLDIDRFRNITVGADTGRYFPYYLQANTTPVLALYDKRKRLRGIFGNKPQVDTLIAKIREL